MRKVERPSGRYYYTLTASILAKNKKDTEEKAAPGFFLRWRQRGKSQGHSGKNPCY